MPKQQPKRSAVDPAETWDLTAIFATEADYEAALKKVQALTRDFGKMYRGRLTQARVITDALADYANILALLDRVNHYAFLPQATDTTDPALNARLKQAEQIGAQIAGQLSFFQSELQQQPDAVLDEAVAGDVDATAYMRHVKLEKAQALPPAAEEAIATLGPALDAPQTIRDQTLFADADFGTFTVAGTEYPLSFTLYEEEYQKHPDTAVRRAAYRQFSSTLARYQNTMAAGYYAQVAKEKTLATMRGYDSVIDYLLAPQEVSRALFDRQIDVIMDELAPVMQKYVTHIKTLWGLDHIGYTDLQIDLDPAFAPVVTLKDAPAYVASALAPMGEAYQAMIAHAFDERWVDFPANIGKASGAFATKPFGVHPYVEMTWSDSLPAMYTLIHELGHTGQMTLADHAHGILGHEPSIYIVEGPSTFHELLLTHNLIEQADDPRLKRFALSRLLSDTYFHNCVTHLLEAAFQREVYTLIDNGEAFDAARLSELKLGVLKRFWGDAVDLTDGAPELTWMRQAHYYMGLYSYTYSASMVVSTGAYLRLQAGDPTAIKDWQEFLALGDSLPPIEAAKIAGVNLETAQPLHDMIAFLADTERTIEALSAQID